MSDAPSTNEPQFDAVTQATVNRRMKEVYKTVGNSAQVIPDEPSAGGPLYLKRPPGMEPVYGPWTIARTRAGVFYGELLPENLDENGIARLGDWVSIAIFGQDHNKYADIESALDRPWELQEIVSLPREGIILLRDTEPLLGADEENLAPTVDSNGFPRRKKD